MHTTGLHHKTRTDAAMMCRLLRRRYPRLQVCRGTLPFSHKWVRIRWDDLTTERWQNISIWDMTDYAKGRCNAQCARRALSTLMATDLRQLRGIALTVTVVALLLISMPLTTSGSIGRNSALCTIRAHLHSKFLSCCLADRAPYQRMRDDMMPPYVIERILQRSTDAAAGHPWPTGGPGVPWSCRAAGRWSCQPTLLPQQLHAP